MRDTMAHRRDVPRLRSGTRCRPLIAALMCLWCASAIAAETRLLKEDEVSESALAEALTPPPRTRSLKPVPPASASLLITFQTNSTQLTPEARRMLDVVARALSGDRLAQHSFIIEGHADRRGSRDANARLSAARADAVREYLVNNHGIATTRLKSVGKGDSEPLKPEDPAARENRRVTFVTVN